LVGTSLTGYLFALFPGKTGGIGIIRMTTALSAALTSKSLVIGLICNNDNKELS
jgi:hypothetical protein